MSNGAYGALWGLVLGLVWVFQSFPAMLLVAAAGLVGWGVGRFVRIDLSALGKRIEQLLSR
ncbi:MULTISPECIES: hypothetical protein [Levilactobacillus]|jgi:hypothetical protein|uniref:DUF2273 domain-containing protein n=2 Tax=Levilactobacillus brevis TaxID=1580 RepID=A0A2A3TYV9_LEVBR|nr:hypothetical protein [Levilactobacillus brevis]ANN49161.1 hypothetical protein A6F53_07855 [Levilactobacillus brevis]ARW50548.1 hypothetical protein S101106_01065 [Levilactobacillus brevis]ATU69108.1 hypothetical protein CT113_01670 [Levilactobacillus brevis]ERK44683.1 hypothetical protein HMPREF0495_00749 [Levilactobacillus brevis ATCC 14869 = DSM 20054]KIR08664.1 hypothetical protein RA16_06675 [Levilactobacillus brevis]